MKRPKRKLHPAPLRRRKTIPRKSDQAFERFVLTTNVFIAFLLLIVTALQLKATQSINALEYARSKPQIETKISKEMVHYNEGHLPMTYFVSAKQGVSYIRSINIFPFFQILDGEITKTPGCRINFSGLYGRRLGGVQSLLPSAFLLLEELERIEEKTSLKFVQDYVGITVEFVDLFGRDKVIHVVDPGGSLIYLDSSDISEIDKFSITANSAVVPDPWRTVVFVSHKPDGKCGLLADRISAASKRLDDDVKSGKLPPLRPEFFLKLSPPNS